MPKSTPKDIGSKSKDRPKWPYPESRLYAHPSGYWSKKINGKILSFGRWGRMAQGKVVQFDAEELKTATEEAAQNFRKRFGDALDGRIVGNVVQAKADSDSDQLTLESLCEDFLTEKQGLVDSGELSPRTLQELVATGNRLCAALGKKRSVEDLEPADFATLRTKLLKGEKVKQRSPQWLANEITRVRSFFIWADKNGHLKTPVRFGTTFNKPKKSVMQRHKATRDKRLFTAAELWLMLDALEGKEVTLAQADEATGKRVTVTMKADPALRAMVLLGINAGAGNTDVGTLTFDDKELDLKGGWITRVRQKTGNSRRTPLWPETIAAIKTAINRRPAPKANEDRDILFLTRFGERYVRLSGKAHTDCVAGHFTKLLRALKINGRTGLGFYSLRHTFATVALDACDRDAVKAMMGHSEGDVLALYDETGPSDERRRRVVDHVRTWLFGKEGGEE